MHLGASFAPIEKGVSLRVLAWLRRRAGEPGAHAQIVQRTLHRFDLVDLVVALQAIGALFPQLAVARFLPTGAGRRAVHMQIELERSVSVSMNW
jgi:hypothetical protein